MNNRTYTGFVTELKSNEVFVFGSNLDGFHGAGAAGYASFGVPGNQWRKFDYANQSNGWKGKWNVKGVGEGLQEGTEGKSYALPTVNRIQDRDNYPKEKIRESIARLYECARQHPELDFLIAYRHDGTRLLNGYSIEEMAEMFGNPKYIPDNIVFEVEFYKLIVP